MIRTTILLLIALEVCLGFSINGPKILQNRIVGGQNLTDDEVYPYMVSIRYLDYDTHACGGAIITKRTILTAAHCINQTTYDNIVIIAGTNYWDNGGTRYRAQELISHPGYNLSIIANDVGLVIVNREIVYTPTVQPIKYGTEVVGGNANAFNIGWGLTSDRGEVSDVLKYLDVKTMTNADCASKMGDFAPLIFESSLCSNGPPNESVCSSDSGGPLVYDNKVIGLVSWGFGGCAKGNPEVNARVSSYSDWIAANLVE